MSNLTTACRKCNQEKSNKDIFPKQQSSGLVGMCLHTWVGKDLHWQGRIIGSDGPDVIVQLYSWLDGEPTEVVLIDRQDVKDKQKVTLYANNRDMVWASLEHSRRKGELEGSVEENMEHWDMMERCRKGAPSC